MKNLIHAFYERSCFRILIFQILIIMAVIISCTRTGRSRKSNRNFEDRPADTLSASISVNKGMDRGLAVYNQVCLICHQANGSGVPMMFPSVAGSDVVLGDHKKLIDIVLNGMQGPLDVNGDRYNGVMPPQKDNLTDRQVADLLTYIRSAFGNSADSVSVKEVAAQRK